MGHSARDTVLCPFQLHYIWSTKLFPIGTALYGYYAHIWFAQSPPNTRLNVVTDYDCRDADEVMRTK